MQPKLLKSSQLGEFIPAEFNGVNESGYEPVCDRVLVLPDMASARTTGGIELPAELVDRHTMAAETGVIVAVGPEAFKWTPDKTREWTSYKPKPGDRVYIQRYSGQVMLGEDGKFYRLMDYTCCGAVKKTAPKIYEGDPVVECGSLFVKPGLIGSLR
jgi:chaperonin GroES